MQGSADARALAHELAQEHAEEIRRGEAAPSWPEPHPASAAPYVDYLTWLMDRDRKSPALKRLQGWIWEEGYQAGQLRGEVYPDVPRALRRWRAAGVSVSIYSSGSELAQRRLFESTGDGDLTPLVSRFFDTAVGNKRDPASYGRIARELGERPADILFVSDVTAELAAAREAGYQTRLSVRDGNPPQPDDQAYDTIRSFDEVG
jgi:enolase-phosphatase E1